VVNHDAIFELVCCSFYLFSKQENVWKVLTFWVISLNLRERAGKMSQFFNRLKLGKLILKITLTFRRLQNAPHLI